eukprot:6552865-Pyramimonas_sp.AAC.1
MRPYWAVLGAPRAVLETSSSYLGLPWGQTGLCWGILEAIFAALKASWRQCGSNSPVPFAPRGLCPEEGRCATL